MEPREQLKAGAKHAHHEQPSSHSAALCNQL